MLVHATEAEHICGRQTRAISDFGPKPRLIEEIFCVRSGGQILSCGSRAAILPYSPGPARRSDAFGGRRDSVSKSSGDHRGPGSGVRRGIPTPHRDRLGGRAGDRAKRGTGKIGIGAGFGPALAALTRNGWVIYMGVTYGSGLDASVVGRGQKPPSAVRDRARCSSCRITTDRLPAR